mmetsp:Transcript_26652/g.51662  ORF Transcript_26652/g.51662 Transcript_26652/m.51662 type:complete len:293 (+) Transcript_26652:161-1039(+)
MCPVQMKDPATAPYVISIWIQAFVMLNQFLWAIRIYRQKLNERKRVVFWASVGAMVTSLVYITVWYGGSWEGRVIATCVITTVLISICSHMSMSISNAQFAIANLSLQPRLWAPRIMFGGILLVTIANVLAAVGILVTGKKIWDASRLISIGIGITVSGGYLVYSSLQLRINLMSSIGDRMIHSVYIHVVGDGKEVPEGSTGRKSHTKSTTAEEAQLLSRLLSLSVSVFVVTAVGLAINIMFIVRLLNSDEKREERYATHFDKMRSHYDASEDAMRWAVLASTSMFLYYCSW